MNLCNVVPAGLVVFLPSYRYEARVFSRWRATGLLGRIRAKKAVHREPKNSRDVEAALAAYSKETTVGRGALLVSVIGGKMSEGINFADDMARCVLVVGLPYPDVTDPELQEKMRSLDRDARERKLKKHGTGGGGGGIDGRAYYQNLCMRAVNQSAGRAIRHANDYAAIILADFRYASDTRVWGGLPPWLRAGRRTPEQGESSFGKVLGGVRSFFAEHRTIGGL